jgi:hypothetical protein
VKERSSFLKKSSKKLLLTGPAAENATVPNSKSFFAAFFSKKAVLT